nr:hypothetical protein [Tanacetum cinerariifolium]
ATVKAKTVKEEGQLQALADGKKILITESTIRRDLQLEDAKGVDCLPNALQALVDGKKVIITESTIRRDLQLEDVKGVDCLPNAAIFKQLTQIGAATTATSLDIEQDRGNIFKTQSKETPNEPGSQGTSSGGGPRSQETIGDAVAQTRSKRVSKISNDPLLIRFNTPQSGEDSLKLNELMELCTNLQNKGRISDINADDDITLANTHDEQMFDADQYLRGEEVFVAQQDENVIEKEADVAQVQVTTTVTTPTILIDEATLAQALAELKHAKPKTKAKGIVFHELEESITTTTAAIPKPKSHVKDKGKAKMIEEPDDVQAKIDADYQLARRIQAKEQQELNDAEKEKLFMRLLEKRRKFFIAKRAEEKRNKPPTQAQQRKITCTYLKNMEGKKLIDLKNKSFDSIQKMFDRSFKRVNTLVDYRTELVEKIP